MSARFLVPGLAVLLVAITAHSLGVLGDGVPTLSSPYPLFLVLLAFMGVPVLVLALAYGVVFLAWTHELMRNEVQIPRRSIVLLIAGCVGSALIFAGGWNYGVQYQGLTYVVGALGMTIAAVVFLGVVLLWNSRSPSLANSATFHFVLFAWLGTYAVPYLGETP